jgi:hypothetical protein
VADPQDPTMPPFPRSVAVKVIHPGVKRHIELDLELLRAAGRTAEGEGEGDFKGGLTCSDVAGLSKQPILTSCAAKSRSPLVDQNAR